MNPTQKKVRKAGENLLEIFVKRLDDLGVTIKQEADLRKIDPRLTAQSSNIYSINNHITYIAYGNSSASENVKFGRIYWGIKRKTLEEITQIPNSVIIFLGGRNLSKIEREKGLLFNDFSSDLQKWLCTDLIEFVLIFPASEIWKKLAEFAKVEPLRTDWKFNYHLHNPRFVGVKKNYIQWFQNELQSKACNRYDQLGLPSEIISVLQNEFKLHFKNIKRPWHLIQELKNKYSISQPEKPTIQKLTEEVEKSIEKPSETTQKVVQIIDRLLKSDQLSSKPSEYVYDIADAFEYLGFDTKIVDTVGDTDIVLTANLGEQSYRIILDAKTSEKGKIIESRINWPAIMDHKELREADYVGIVGKNFAEGRLITRAEQFEVALIKTTDLIRFLEIYTKSPFSLVTFQQIFQTYGFVKEEIIENLTNESHHRQERLNLIGQMLLKLRNLEEEDPEPKIDTLYYELGKKYPLEDIQEAAKFLTMSPLKILEFNEKTARVKLSHGKKGINDILLHIYIYFFRLL